jgi:hypothetical protein
MSTLLNLTVAYRITEPTYQSEEDCTCMATKTRCFFEEDTTNNAGKRYLTSQCRFGCDQLLPEQFASSRALLLDGRTMTIMGS